MIGSVLNDLLLLTVHNTIGSDVPPMSLGALKCKDKHGAIDDTNLGWWHCEV